MVSPNALNIPVPLVIIHILAIRLLPPLIGVWVAASVFSVRMVLATHTTCPLHGVSQTLSPHAWCGGEKVAVDNIINTTFLPSLVPSSHTFLILVVLAITPLVLIYSSSTHDLPSILSPFNFLIDTMLHLCMRPSYLYLCFLPLLVMCKIFPPGLHNCSLLSIGQLCDSGYEVLFTKTHMSVLSKDHWFLQSHHSAATTSSCSIMACPPASTCWLSWMYTASIKLKE